MMLTLSLLQEMGPLLRPGKQRGAGVLQVVPPARHIFILPRQTNKDDALTKFTAEASCIL